MCRDDKYKTSKIKLNKTTFHFLGLNLRNIKSAVDKIKNGVRKY